MHRISRRLLVVLVVVGALAAGGAAYTNSITGGGTTNNTAGYADVSVAGATLADAVYGFNANGTQVNSVTFTFTGNLTNDTLQFGLGTTANPAVSACTGTNVTAGVIQSAAYSSPSTTVTCTGLTVATSGATDLGVLVSNS